MPLPPGAEPPLPPASLSTSLNYSASNPTTLLDRLAVRELMEGFPAHRDACEWRKMRALFAEEDAYVFTTWSGGVPIDRFIEISYVFSCFASLFFAKASLLMRSQSVSLPREAGFAKGVKIAHRVNGGTVDVAISGPAAGKRGLGKLKATITQRFTMPTETEGETCEVDVEADCRLCFFVEKKANGEWKNHFFKGFYEKDRAIPVDPRRIPRFDDEKLASFPEGYRYLAYGQSAAYKIKLDLPQSRGEEHDRFYESFIHWLEGASIETMKQELGV
ncbi:Pea pathogenicity protein 2 [Rhodotorula toruloides]|nr:Pea pathogenicity protein 2 [Rhodotorula toruloides]